MKIFCKHDYIYFHRSKYLMIPETIWEDRWHFVCKKCEKVKKINQDDVRYYSDKFSKQVSKERVLGIDNSRYEGYEFILGYTIFQGKLAYYMGRKFNKYKQDKVESCIN